MGRRLAGEHGVDRSVQIGDELGILRVLELSIAPPSVARPQAYSQAVERVPPKGYLLIRRISRAGHKCAPVAPSTR